jgi:hypothetical protein
MPLGSRSTCSQPNANLRQEPARDGEGNRKWLARLGDENGIILIGGTSLADFRVRVAQSTLRDDMFPSYWSMSGILLKGGKFVSTPLESDDISGVPKSNGVRELSLDDYDDPNCFPNIAVIRFAKVHDSVHDDIDRLKRDRGIIDLPAMMLPWFAYIWGTKGASNPLLQGNGLPSAAFVETVFAMSGFELTPGLSSASSCPEAMWQSAKWWTDFYKSTTANLNGDAGKSGKSKTAKANPPTAVPMVPEGYFKIGQVAAGIVEQ